MLYTRTVQRGNKERTHLLNGEAEESLFIGCARSIRKNWDPLLPSLDRLLLLIRYLSEFESRKRKKKFLIYFPGAADCVSAPNKAFCLN